MYATLNEIVQEQGETLTKIEDNMVCTKGNTKKTVDELGKALKMEKGIREKLCGVTEDMGMMCLTMWVIVAFAFFFVDLLL